MEKRFPVIVEKIDRNGSKHIVDHNCPKCGGSGYIPGYEFIDGARCWKCNATGHFTRKYIIRTPEYERKLAARRIERARIKNLAERPAFLEENGFNEDGITYVVVGNTYEIKDVLKAMGAKFNEFIKWHLPFDPEGYTTVEMSVEECFREEETGLLYWKSVDELTELVAKKAPAIPVPETNYIGNVGDKITLELTQVACFTFDSQFGICYINKFKDTEGNVVIWKTSRRVANDGENVTLKGTIKEHNEFRTEKQTILTRCKTL
jgi:hypothetical protein